MACLEEDLGAGVPLLAAMTESAAMDLRINPARADRVALRAVLADQGMTAEPTPLSPYGLRVRERRPIDGLPAFKDGHFEVQDEAARWPPLWLAPGRGCKFAIFAPALAATWQWPPTWATAAEFSPSTPGGAP